MATISKFYLLDAATPNTGTMRSDSPTVEFGGADTGDATGASTARDATDVAGTSQITTTITANADLTAQVWGHRRFVSRPLAAHTFAPADGNWTLSAAFAESNLNHNAAVTCFGYIWRPGSGARVGSGNGLSSPGAVDGFFVFLSEPTVAATEQAKTSTAAWNKTAGTTIQDGDILVFDFLVQFTQGTAKNYTDSFSYNGTTEASATSCASFVTPPAALTLFTAAAATARPTQTVVRQAVQRAATRCWARRPQSSIIVPRLWTPESDLAVI